MLSSAYLAWKSACLVGGNKQDTAQVARKYAIPHHTGDLGEGMERADAVILTSPTPLHRKHAEQVMRARKHVLIEIPIADSVETRRPYLQFRRKQASSLWPGTCAASIQVISGSTRGSRKAS